LNEADNKQADLGQELARLSRQYHDAPEEEKKKILLLIRRAMPKDAVHETKKIGLAQVAQKFSEEGFEAFYELLHDEPMAAHLKKAVRKAFLAHEKGVPFLFLGFRGCRKTTTFSVDFTSYFIGHFPHLTNLVVGASDANPEMICKTIAQNIEFHPDWKRVFPHVVPDKTGEGKGWSNSGYWVTDTRLSREQWTARQASVVDPTFVGGGYLSARINGRHPTGILAPDDIHDIESSTSELERNRIRDVYFGQIEKTVVRSKDKLITWVNMMGVPFARDDTYQTIRDSGHCVTYILPCMTRAAENASGAVYLDGLNKANGRVYEDIIGWWFLTAPEIFGVESVISERALGKPRFWQMHMMDIWAARDSVIRYHSYDHTKIDPTWPHGGGCDFATLGTQRNIPDKQRDKFSIAVGGKTPFNQVVVDGGFLGQVTQAHAEARLQSAQDTHVSWRGTKFEVQGSGEQFFLTLAQRNPKLILTAGRPGRRNKDDRILNELGPWLENGQILISDERTDFLDDLRQSLDDFPDGNKDIRDSLYYLALNFPECLVIARPVDEGLGPRKHKRGLKSPWGG